LSAESFYEPLSGGHTQQLSPQQKRSGYAILAYCLIALALILTVGFVSAKYFNFSDGRDKYGSTVGPSDPDFAFHGTLTLEGKNVDIDLKVNNLTMMDIIKIYKKIQDGEKINGTE